MSRQYARLAQAELAGDDLHRYGHAGRSVPGGAGPAAAEPPRLAEPQAPAFYGGGFQHKHWVLVLCAVMVLCEWMDRTALSIAMEAIKEEFKLTDTQIGMMASSSLWMVPFTIAFAGRLSDYVPKSKLLGLGLFGWGGCTMLTGSARSFRAIILSRLFAGLSNCAGYPVAIALLAEFFGACEMTTAMGYVNAGCAIGGLLGLAAGGLLITQVGWRWAFWCIGAPQLVIAVLLATTVHEESRRAPRQQWFQDLCTLVRLPSLRLLMLAGIVTGLLSGNNRFLSALMERLYGLDAQTIGTVMGITLGVIGVFAAWCGGHVVDRFVQKTGESRATLWCAAVGDAVHVAAALAALLAPTFGLCVMFLAIATCGAGLGQGVTTANQQLACGRRGTTQSLFELCWSIGMALGPFTSGTLSDALESGTCDEACALRRGVMIVGALGYVLRILLYLTASWYFPADVSSVEAEQAAEDSPKSCGAAVNTAGNSSCGAPTSLENGLAKPHVSATPCSVELTNCELQSGEQPGLTEQGTPQVTKLGRSSDL